jgi:hypothetical protein
LSRHLGPLAVICSAGHQFAGAYELDLREVLGEPVIDVPRGWWVRELFDRMVEGRDLARRVRLEVNEWFGALTTVQRGVRLNYGPLACIDTSVFGDLGSPLWPAPPSGS